MKHSTRRTAALMVATAAALGITAYQATPASSWSPPVITVHPEGCELGLASLYNPEGGTAHVTASNVFVVGSAIPGHGTISQEIAGTGSLHITVTVDFPDHASASADFEFTRCPRDTTTTTTPDQPTTTTAPPTAPTMNPGPPPSDPVVHPKFTG
jgi:hypothetical protein